MQGTDMNEKSISSGGPDAGSRRETESIDQRMAELLSRRLALSGGPAADAAEVAVLRRTVERLAAERRFGGALSGTPEDIPARADGTLESVRRVSFGGTTGSFSEKAARTMFPSAERVARRTFPEACDVLAAGGCDAAVLPLRNTTGGSVDTVYRLLQRRLYVVRYTDLYIEHCLAALPGAALSGIRTVVSHPQAFAQCSRAISRHGWRMEPADNTAFAPGIVIASGDPSRAAICSREAAEANGLVVLEGNICDTPRSDITRFVAVARGMAVTPDASLLSILVHLPHRTGSLAAALAVLADLGLNLSAISAQPVPEKPWEYSFFLDIEAPALDPAALAALRQFAAEMPMLRIVGWYGRS